MSRPPGRSSEADGGAASDIGHGALDVLGFVPGVGEAADLANAAWYAAEEQYLEAGLSLISMIPVVGDLIGKGGKAARKLGPRAGREVLEGLKKLHIEKHLESLRGHPKLGKHIDRIQEALRKWQDDLRKGGDLTDATKATTRCPDALRPTSNGLVPRRNPDKATTILGRWEPDMKDVKSQVNPKIDGTKFDAGPGDFNILNAPPEAYEKLGKERFFEEVNKPFLDKAIARGDDIVIASDPFDPKNVFDPGGVLTTFGKEIDHLYRNGYRYDSELRAMTKN